VDAIVEWTFDDTIPKSAYRGPACMLEGLDGVRPCVSKWKALVRQKESQRLDHLATAQASCSPCRDIIAWQDHHPIDVVAQKPTGGCMSSDMAPAALIARAGVQLECSSNVVLTLAQGCQAQTTHLNLQQRMSDPCTVFVRRRCACHD